jgi:hypothetical protein
VTTGINDADAEEINGEEDVKEEGDDVDESFNDNAVVRFGALRFGASPYVNNSLAFIRQRDEEM